MTRLIRCLRNSAGSVLTCASIAASVTYAANLEKVVTVEGITEYRLDNGLQVLLFPDPSQPTITVNVTYRVGSRHEGRGEAGMAHLLEHMVFKGTSTHPNIWGALEDHGATFNGSTWVDRTNYFETLPASDENLEFALTMEADRMVNSLIRGEDLAKEMSVVRNEFEMGENSPSSVLSERMMSAAYLWHNYGKSTIGNRSDIERVPVESLRAFYRQYYQPDNATLLVAGRFEPRQVLDVIARTFAAIPRPERKLADTYTEEPPQDGPRLVTLKRVGDVATVGLIYHVPAGSHPEFPAVEILTDVLSDQPTGHLYRRLIVPGTATNVTGSAFAWAEPGVVEFSARVAPEHDPRAVLDYMIETVEGVTHSGLSEEEVERAKLRQAKAYKLGMTNSARIGIRLSESIAQGDWRLFFVHRDRLAKVTLEDVRHVATRYLAEANRTAGMFIPTSQPNRVAVSATPNVADIVRNYRSTESVTAGEALTPDVDAIEQRVTRQELLSGIRVALLPVQTRGNAVYVGMRLRYGTEAVLQDQLTASQLIAPLMMRGTQQRTFEQLRTAIDKLQSRISVGGGRGRGRRGGGSSAGGELGTIPASIETDREHLLGCLDLLAEILREPAFDEDEFRRMVDRQIAQLEQGRSDPMMQGMNSIRRAMAPFPPESLHYVPTLEERIDRLRAVQVSDFLALHGKHVGASHLDVAVVGDFDSETLMAALHEHFGGWPSPSPYKRVVEPYCPSSPGTTTILTPDKKMAMVAMGTTFRMREDDPRFPAMTLASYVFGQSAKSRLINRLRHEGGLSYGARAMLSADAWEPRASILGMAICAPQNSHTALEAMREEFHRWVQKGITDEELKDAIESYTLRFRRTLTNEQSLVQELVDGFARDRTLQFRGDLLDNIQKLTVRDVSDVLQSVLGTSGFAEILAGDLPASPDA